MNEKLKRVVRIGFYSALGMMLLLALCDVWITFSTQSKIYSEVNKVPNKKVAVVLGARPHGLNGKPNYYFVYRIRAAVELYRSKKVEYIIVSGDNGRKEYDESTEMKMALMREGIPADKIYVDYAGFRTLDSIVRCKEIFGEDDIIVVSQNFHNQRALFLAKSRGIEAVGFNAKDLNNRYGLGTHLRERLARVKAFIDVVLSKQPKYLGDPIIVGVDKPV